MIIFKKRNLSVYSLKHIARSETYYPKSFCLLYQELQKVKKYNKLTHTGLDCRFQKDIKYIARSQACHTTLK